MTFRIDSEDQDSRRPYLAVGYSTEGQVAQVSPAEAWEARWSYAYFPPSGLEGVRTAGNDPEGAGLFRREAEELGFWDDEERLDGRFRELCVDLARWLHAEGHLVKALGRPLPIVLYDMFDPDAMFAMTRDANPAELVEEFLAEDPEAQNA
ncbi:hypothetical protein [Spirillospora sp. NPDC029432]|uniref:hypothetical protein n=1 Tax=Spirillospora sp. NPDC029432 TaxID=3154599 RepID=UPI003453E557